MDKMINNTTDNQNTYKQYIVKYLDKIENEEYLKKIYSFIKAFI